MSYESVRYWWHRFGSQFASQIKKRRAGGMQASNWKWHLDEVFVKINGERHYLWRAVDHEVLSDKNELEAGHAVS